jgi:hypothetical protein
MVVLSNIQIAGIDIVISCDDSIILLKPASLYDPFLTNPNACNTSPALTIDLKINSMPRIKHLKQIFDSGQSWSMFMHNDDYFLALGPPALDGKEVWITHFRRDLKKATIYCSDLLIRKINGRVELSNPFSYPLDQLIVMYLLSGREGAIIHAAGMNRNGKGYLFPGKSGAGKSTLTRQFANGNNHEFLSDDRIAARKINSQFKIFGTPWPGEAGIAVNKSVHLSGIFFITQANSNRIEEIAPQKAVERLFPVVSIPWYDKEAMIKMLDFCHSLISDVPAYELFFKPDTEVVDVFEKFALQE